MPVGEGQRTGVREWRQGGSGLQKGMTKRKKEKKKKVVPLDDNDNDEGSAED